MDHPVPPRPPGAWHRSTFLLALLPFLGLALWRISWEPEASMGDYAQYLLHARALLEGRSYADIGYIVHAEAADIGPPMYPPGLPLALVPVIAVAGMNPVAHKLVMMGCLIGFGVLAFRRLARDLPVPAVAVGVAFALIGIEIQQGTVAPMSDPLFCVVLWLLFVVADTPERWSAGRTAAVAVLGFALVATRLAGAAIGPAVFLFGVVQWRRHGLRPFVVVAIWGAASLAAALAAGNPYGDSVVDRDLPDIGRKLYFLASNYRYTLVEAELYPFGIKALDKVYHAVITPVILVGAVVVIRRLGMTLITCFVATYLVELLIVRVGAGRFLWPLLPLLGVSMVLGLLTMTTRIRQWRTKGPDASPTPSRVAVLVPAVLLLAALGRQLGASPPFAITGTPDADGLYGWLRSEHARSPARVLFHNPRVLALHAGVPAMGIPERTTPGQLVAVDADRLTHVVWQREDASTCLQRLVNALPVRYPDRFELAYANATFRVYRVRAAAAPFAGAWERIDWRDPAAICGA